VSNRHIPPEVKARYLSLRQAGFSQAAARREVKVSANTSHRWDHLLPPGVNSTKDLRSRTSTPPRSFDQLSDEAKRALEDFDFFCERYLVRRPVPWRTKAAKLSIEMLLDSSERHEVVANLPPGSGKTSLWTCDLPLWLVCGGGLCDPARGRSLRFQLGHEVAAMARLYVSEIRRLLESRTPYYDGHQRRAAEASLVEDFGRFKGLSAEGEEVLWKRDQLLVAPVGDEVTAEIAPTFVAVARDAAILGWRAHYIAWDDLVTRRSSNDPDLPTWFENEAESRLDPGGVLWLVGARVGPHDLFRNRLDQRYADDDGVEHQVYVHIVFPGHHDATCDAGDEGDDGVIGSHRQWDAEPEGDGCLLDQQRLPWRELEKLRQAPRFKTTYQQEDIDPATILVPQVWINGGTDDTGYEAPGCLDRQRWFWQSVDIPDHSFVNYLAVDPAEGGKESWWSIELWRYDTSDRTRYLIYGTRGRWTITEILRLRNGELGGILQDIAWKAKQAGMPVGSLAIEINAARTFVQQDDFNFWVKAWGIDVIPFQTGRNKTDPVKGLYPLLQDSYRQGKSRLPWFGKEPLDYVRTKIRELTTYPMGSSDDCVMSEWVGACSLDRISTRGERVGAIPFVDLRGIPDYLRRERERSMQSEKPRPLPAGLGAYAQGRHLSDFDRADLEFEP
jgi:hypothetical protein